MYDGDGNSWQDRGFDRKYWLTMSYSSDRQTQNTSAYNDFYFPSLYGIPSASWARDAWVRQFGSTYGFGGSGLQVSTGMSLFQRAIKAIGNYNNATALMQYIESREWPTMVGRYAFDRLGAVTAIDRGVEQFQPGLSNPLIHPGTSPSCWTRRTGSNMSCSVSSGNGLRFSDSIRLPATSADSNSSLQPNNASVGLWISRDRQ